MTIKLYEQNVYLKNTKAKVIQIIEDGYVFDQTIFAPFGGGQDADKGTINNIEVKDVRDKDGHIIHYLADQLTDETVIMEIDWAFRLDQMQQHCGEHILSGIIKDKYNGNNKGFHMGSDYVTVDIDIQITNEMLDEIELAVNDVIYQNIELSFDYSVDLEGLDLPIRKAATVEEDIRVVTIPGVDCVACCGTHPTRTGDVGLIKLYKVEKNKGMSRIYFKCGRRAVEDLNRKTKIINQLNKQYSSDDSTLLDRMASEKDKYEKIKKQFIALNRDIIDTYIEKNTDESKAYQKMVIDYLPSQDMNYVIKKVSEKMNTVILVYSKSENKVMLSHDGSHDINCGALFRSIKTFNGKGGGSMKVAQGVFEDLDDGLKFIDYLVSNLK